MLCFFQCDFQVLICVLYILYTTVNHMTIKICNILLKIVLNNT